MNATSPFLGAVGTHNQLPHLKCRIPYLNQSWRRTLKSFFFLPGALMILTSCSPAKPPSPPISLTQFSNVFKSFPRCDQSVPACKVSSEQAYSNLIAEANSLLDSRSLSGFIMRVDQIRQSDRGGWDVRGKVAWDLASENATSATGVGLTLGLATVLSGGSIMEGLGSAALATKDAYKTVGQCLTSTDIKDKPFVEIQVSLKGVTFPDLTGIDKDTFIAVAGASLLPFKARNGLLTNTGSTFYIPSGREFGSVAFEGTGGYGASAGKEVKTKRYCLSGSEK